MKHSRYLVGVACVGMVILSSVYAETNNVAIPVGASQWQGGMMNGPMGSPMMGSGMMMPVKFISPMMGSGQFMGSGMKIPPMMPMIGSGMQQGGVDFLRGYIRTDLTEEEKIALKKILDDHRKKTDALMQTIRSSGQKPTDDQLATLKADKTQFLVDLTPYIDPSRLAAFKQSFETMGSGGVGHTPMMNGSMMSQGQMNMMNGQGMYPGMNAQPLKSKYSLSEKTRTQLATKLDAIPVEKRVDFFTKLVERVDALLVKAKSEKLKSQLNEIKEMVQERLDELDAGSEEDLIDELTK